MQFVCLSLSPVHLQLSHLKPLSAQWITGTEAQGAVKANRKLVSKGFEKAGIADALSYEAK